jgi:prophage DNA circulation protein
MADETEVIRDKMEATRQDLSDKIEKLENKVMDTVQDATSTVNEAVQGAKEVVETVKDTVEGAVEGVQGTVDAVKGGVANAAEGVRETLSNAAESVRDAFDLPAQVDRHPWLMMGGAVAVGFVAGKLLDYGPEAMEAMQSAAESGGRLAESITTTAGHAASAAGTAASAAGNWLGALEHMFGPELAKVKELALGALLGMARDAAVQAAPEPMRRQVGEIFDSFTSKLGGRPIEGAVLGPRPAEEHEPDGPGRRF